MEIIGEADEFTVELDEDGMIYLLDGEQAIRVMMPLEVWKELSSGYS